MTTGPPQPRLRNYAIAALLLAGISDTLFFANLGRPLGLSAPLFPSLLASAIAICNRRFLSRRLVTPALLLPLGFAALLEVVDLKSLCLAAACLALFSMAVAGRLPDLSQTRGALGRFFLGVSLSLPKDNNRRVRAQRRAKQRGHGRQMSTSVGLVWLIPLAFAVGFTLFLAAGNLILERWLSLIDLSWIVGFLIISCVGFWLLVAMLTWPFLRPRQRRNVPSLEAPALAGTISHRDAQLLSYTPFWSQHVYGRAAILRALFLFNAVFAVETLQDAAYLWSGIELPDGISYAANAQRGAYMLVTFRLGPEADRYAVRRAGRSRSSRNARTGMDCEYSCGGRCCAIHAHPEMVPAMVPNRAFLIPCRFALEWFTWRRDDTASSRGGGPTGRLVR